jgi:hypothetical protein
MLQPVADLLKSIRGSDSEIGTAGEETSGWDYEQIYLQTLARNIGDPLLLTSPDLLPPGWTSASP